MRETKFGADSQRVQMWQWPLLLDETAPYKRSIAEIARTEVFRLADCSSEPGNRRISKFLMNLKHASPKTIFEILKND